MYELENAAGAAQNDAEIFTLLAAFYHINPDRELAETLKGIETEGIEDPELRLALERVKDDAARAGEGEITALKCDWTRLFRGVSPEYGPKPPYEELYGGGKSPEILTELAALYHEAGYDSGGNRPDYAGTQLGYLAALSALAAQAAAAGDRAAYERRRAQADRFMERFRTWYARFYGEAEKHAETDFYRGVLALGRLAV